MTIEKKANRIIEDVRNEKGVNPIKMFKSMAKSVFSILKDMKKKEKFVS
nr:hypothetical protein [uncultured Butyrivibrio sp.]